MSSNTPITLGVVIAIVTSVALLIGGLAVGGSYWIAISARNSAIATQQSLLHREQQSSLRSAVPTCNALGALKTDANDLTRLFQSSPGTKTQTPAQKAQAAPLYNFLNDFGAVYNASHCSAVEAFARSQG